MNSPSITSPLAIAARCPAPSRISGQDRRAARPADPFAQRFGKALPRELRLEAAQMSWPTFEAAYAPSSGPLRLSAWSEQRINSAKSTYSATLGIERTICHASADAAGPISAMTAMLHEAGFPMEVTSFHQQQAGEMTATFIYCTNGARRHWAMGMGASCTDSIVNAFVSAANLLNAT
ncbi:hypothetical protein [Tomitella biformata]|uniref:hypothetical protein n=1 Tax=Tomitella biformata TaxID=630403 RepID=UPI00046376D4|nr:hypothetical protein [Tomitella biformata]